MPAFWLDANVFITPKDSYYSPAIAPGYWELLDQWQARSLSVPLEVYKEITQKPDALGVWAKAREHSGLFKSPDTSVQNAYIQVANHVNSTYPYQLVVDFLKGADPWIIAHALAGGDVVVTFETRRDNGVWKIKIPSVCDQFGIPVMSLFQMMQKLGVTLRLQ